MRGQPPIILFTIALGAGLLTGLSRFQEPFLLLGILLGVTWIFRTRWWWPLCLTMALGIHLGESAERRDTLSCSAGMNPGMTRIQLRLLDPGAGISKARPEGGNCAGVIRVEWPPLAGFAAGSLVDVEGSWTPRHATLGRHDGILRVSRAGMLGAASNRWLDRFRSDLASSSRNLYGSRAPLVDALVTGRRGEMAPELRSAFTASGLVHLLAISGFHVALLVGWVLLLLKLLGVPLRWATPLSAGVGICYAAFLGWPAPATRAAFLLTLHAVCRWRQRNPRNSALLAATAFPILVIWPWTIVDVGAWLSITALAGLIAAVRWSDQALGGAAWIRSLSASTGAGIITAPITASVFGQVAPISVLLGLIAGPLAVLLQPALIASLLLHHPAPRLSGALAASGGLLLALFETLVRWGSQLPGAAVTGDAGLKQGLPWLMVLLVAAWAIAGRSTALTAVKRCSWPVTVMLWGSLLIPPRGYQPVAGTLDLIFLDVGQGDAALLRTPAGRWVAIDAGPATPRWNAGEKIVLPFLRRAGAARLDLLIASHVHQDHIGGAAALLSRFPVAQVLEPGVLFPDSGYLEWLTQIDSAGIPWLVVGPGAEWTVDGVHFRILHPPARWVPGEVDLNEASLVLEVSFGAFRALFPGDAGIPAEALLLDSFSSSDLLKVGHHGSRGATSEALLERLKPKLAVISVGQNRYGHPSPEALGRLERAGVPVARTDRHGTILVRSNGSTFQVQGNGLTLSLPADDTLPES